MANCCCRSVIQAWDCPPRRWIRSFLHSLPPSRKAAAWDWPSAVLLSSHMVVGCGRLPTMDEEQHFISLCRPLPCKRQQLERDSVSLRPPHGDTDRDQGKPTARR